MRAPPAVRGSTGAYGESRQAEADVGYTDPPRLALPRGRMFRPRASARFATDCRVRCRGAPVRRPGLGRSSILSVRLSVQDEIRRQEFRSDKEVHMKSFLPVLAGLLITLGAQAQQ